eukprot:PhM_4_TR18822/c3_g2_i1/m.95777
MIQRGPRTRRANKPTQRTTCREQYIIGITRRNDAHGGDLAVGVQRPQARLTADEVHGQCHVRLKARQDALEQEVVRLCARCCRHLAAGEHMPLGGHERHVEGHAVDGRGCDVSQCRRRLHIRGRRHGRWTRDAQRGVGRAGEGHGGGRCLCGEQRQCVGRRRAGRLAGDEVEGDVAVEGCCRCGGARVVVDVCARLRPRGLCEGRCVGCDGVADLAASSVGCDDGRRGARRELDAVECRELVVGASSARDDDVAVRRGMAARLALPHVRQDHLVCVRVAVCLDPCCDGAERRGALSREASQCVADVVGAPCQHGQVPDERGAGGSGQREVDVERWAHDLEVACGDVYVCCVCDDA